MCGGKKTKKQLQTPDLLPQQRLRKARGPGARLGSSGRAVQLDFLAPPDGWGLLKPSPRKTLIPCGLFGSL